MAPLLTFYGDDFTGSSAVMEVLTFAGIPTVMCLDIPSPTLLERLSGVRAIGIAGVARAKDPAWMTRELPRVFAALKALGAPLFHYKTCSTFDSAPHLGSIGRATEIGLDVTGAGWAPLVVGAPALGRYQIFGQLFAALDGVVHRLDRHPVMARHPATPMGEADLCRHLDGQTDLPKAVVDFRALMAGQGEAAIAAARQQGARIIALDVLDAATLAETGRLLWEAANDAPMFAVGSQGVEYALVAHWGRIGLAQQGLALPPIAPARPLLVVSGSCSQTTARQIDRAEGAGFAILPLDACQALTPAGRQAELDRVQSILDPLLAAGRPALVCTARGPDDPAMGALLRVLPQDKAAAAEVHARLGDGLGRLVTAARRRHGLTRAVIAGGDTSGYAMLATGAEALAPIGKLAEGVPLLRVLAGDPQIDGLEVALKGGQMGDPDLFIRAANGTASPG